MTIRHHQPLQVTPGETDQGDLPASGFPDALAVYQYIWDTAALDWVKATAASSGGAITDGQLRASPVPVSITGGGDATAANQVTGNNSLSSIDTKLTSQATGAKQDTSNTSLASIDTKLTNPLPVNLPAGFATSANQDTEKASLASIDVKVPALGQALAASSVPVILPSATITTLTPPAAITGFATSAIQATQQTALDTINTSTAPFVVAAAGGYVRQDSTATIAKESGGNLAQLVTNTTSLATASAQTSGNASLTTIAALSKAEDAAAADADPGMPVLAVRQDVPQTTTSATGDYNSLATDAQGRVWINSDILATKLDLLIELTRQAVREARLQTEILCSGLSVKDDPELYRSDPSFAAVILN